MCAGHFICRECGNKKQSIPATEKTLGYLTICILYFYFVQGDQVVSENVHVNDYDHVVIKFQEALALPV